MKKRSLKKISLQKTVISKLRTSIKTAELLGGFPVEGTSPKCGSSEFESCHGSCEQ